MNEGHLRWPVLETGHPDCQQPAHPERDHRSAQLNAHFTSRDDSAGSHTWASPVAALSPAAAREGRLTFEWSIEGG
jgi:hypothetical protein